MSSRHLFSDPTRLVEKGLRGSISYNSDSLKLIEGAYTRARDAIYIAKLTCATATKVVYDSSHNQDHVSIISGGGAGHEPAWAGYVGTNMLAASASGPIFASPSTKQVLSAIEAVPSKKGTILCVGNYTGISHPRVDRGSVVDKLLHRGLSPFRAGVREGQCGE